MVSDMTVANSRTNIDTREPAQKIIATIFALRKTLLGLGTALLVGTACFYLVSPQIFTFLQDHLQQQLAFFTVTEPFLAHVKLALVTTVITLMPVFIFCLWRALASPFKLSIKSQIAFMITTCLLFYAGSLFCYFVTLPFGITFLLGFESEQLQSVISVGKFVTFVTVFVMAFGLIFELPIFMVFTGKVGLISRRKFSQNRRYALLAIAIVAALLTPTPDVVNMLLMGGPLYLLYEAGILILGLLRIS